MSDDVLNIVDADLLSGTLPTLVRSHANKIPDRIALSFEGRNTTFADLNERTSKIANALLNSGLKPGDHIAHVGKNSDRYFELLLGAGKAGIVLVSVNWRLAAPEIAYILSDSKPNMVFTGAESVENVRDASDAESSVQTICLEDPSEFDDWYQTVSASDPRKDSDPRDAALLLYTSGTTGKPKGAMLSHSGIMAPWRPSSKMPWVNWIPADVTLLVMPVGHIAGSGWGIVSLLNGAQCIILRDFEPGNVLDHLERDGVSRLFLVPSALQMVLSHPRATAIDYSKLKHTLYGASPMPVDLLRQALDTFQCGFVQQYGMTETCGTVAYLPPEDHDPNGNERMRSVGVPVPCAEIKILDEAGKECAPGEIGEIAIRSDSNMLGYWNRPEATAKTIDAQGWLLSGDAASRDDDGYVYLKDRLKDMIISGGENVYPAEVENALFSHPDINQVAVIGVPDSKWGEAVKAVVVLKEGATPDPKGIIRFARERMAAFKAPKSVDFVQHMPLNASGKILKRELRTPYWDGHEHKI